MKKALITSGAWQSALACVQSLGRRKYEVFLVDEQSSSLEYSRFCRKRIPSPPEKSEDQYVEFLIGLVKNGAYDVLIPISDSVVHYCAKHREELQRYVDLLLPDYETLSAAADKARLYTFAGQNHIAVPRTYFPEDLAQVAQLSQENIFPCVLKTPCSVGGKGVFYIRDRAQLMLAYHEGKFDGQWPVIQEFVDGEFFGMTGVAHNGGIAAHFMYRTPREYSLAGTPPVLYAVTDELLLEQAREIISKLGWRGAFNLDFLKDPLRGYVLLEVNPRFGGTLNFAYRMGIDLPYAYCQAAAKAEPPQMKQPAYPQGVMFRTIFPTEILRCFTHPGYGKVFLRNFFTPGNRSNIYWDDPGLLWGQLRETRWYWQDMKQAEKKSNPSAGK